jgi:hypothetical protein
MTGIVYTCLHTNQSRSYLNHLVFSKNTQISYCMKIRAVESECGRTDGQKTRHMTKLIAPLFGRYERA